MRNVLGARSIGATPLIALDGVAFDTETTGLDPRDARIVEAAAVRLDHGKLDLTRPFRRLVRPAQPIPPAATRVHGIDDGAVAAAPPFAEMWPELRDYIGRSVLIGHAIGFDLAVLKRECERAGLAWVRPRSLCTRLLAQVVAPGLADHALEAAAAWLGVEAEGRHSALGDATIAARVFLALLSRLRDCGIRTLAEAEAACSALTPVLETEHRAGWEEAVMAPARAEDEGPFRRLDSYAYRHRIADAMNAPPQFISPKTAVGEAIARMANEKISSLFVAEIGDPSEPMPRPNAAGIITERDALRALAECGGAALALPVGEIASRPLACLPVDTFIYRAIGRMSRLRVRHLGVVDARGRICGALSARDLLRLRAEEAVELGDEIDQAADVPALARAWAKLPHVASALLAEGVSARDIAAVISRELGAAHRRAAGLATVRLRAEGHGETPCPYALAVLGSGGRGESLFAMDQDNAIIFAKGEPGGEADRWFERLGIHMAEILHEIGVPYCRGGVMAKNPQWRGSVATWRARVSDWLIRTRPEDLLSVDIFFDLRAVYGATDMANDLWRDAHAMARGNASFAKLLAEAAGRVEAGLTFFGGFRTEQGRIDLKATGLFGIVTAARVLAICHHVLERPTPARLAGLAALKLGGARDLEALDEAQDVFLDLMLRQQLEDMRHGRPPTNAVAVKRLTRKERGRLHAALTAVKNLDSLVHDLLFKS